MQRLEQNEPTCRECRALGPIAIDKTARVRVKRLIRVEQVLDALGGAWPSTEFTHAIRVDGLKFHYNTKPTTVRCAFERRTHTPHFEGYVAQTACGLFLNVGSDCWSRWIPAIGEVEGVIRETMAYDADIATIAELGGIAKAIAEAETSIVGLMAARRAVLDWIGPLHKRMREANEDPRKREIRVERWLKTERRRQLFETFEPLRGWQLWDEPPSLLRARKQVNETSESIDSARRDDPLLDGAHRDFASRVLDLKRELSVLRRWIEEASTFFLPDNLRRALRDTGQDGEARVDGHSLIVTDKARRVRIDVRGEIELGPRARPAQPNVRRDEGIKERG